MRRSLADSLIVFGNQVNLVRSGTDAFRATFTAIRGAQNSINLKYLIRVDVVSGRVQLSHGLFLCLHAMVGAIMIYVAFGSNCRPAAFSNAMRQTGEKVVEHNPRSGKVWLGPN